MTTQKSGHLQQNPKNTRKTLKNQHLEQFFKSRKRESRSVVRQRRGFWQSLAFDLGLGLQGAPKDMPICPYAHMPNRETEKTQLIRHTLRYITLCFRLSDDQKVRFSMPIDGYLFLFHFFGQRRIIMGTNFERPLGFFRCEMREKIKKVDCNVVLNF